MESIYESSHRRTVTTKHYISDAILSANVRQRTLKSLAIMSPLGTVFVQEGAERRVTRRQTVRTEVFAAPVGGQVQRYPMYSGSSPSSVLHTKAIGKASIFLGSPSLATTPPKTDAVFGSIASRRAICRVSISVVVDDVAVLVDFQHGLEFGVGDDVHGGPERFSEMTFYAQVALLYQMKAGTVALVGGQVETEEGVAVSVVVESQTVPLVLPYLAGRGEQARVAPGEEVFCEVGLEGFGGYLSSVHVHRVEIYGVVLGVKRVFIVRAVVGVVVDAAQYETFRQGTEEQVLVRVRQSSRGNGVHLAVDGS